MCLKDSWARLKAQKACWRCTTQGSQYSHWDCGNIEPGGGIRGWLYKTVVGPSVGIFLGSVGSEHHMELGRSTASVSLSELLLENGGARRGSGDAWLKAWCRSLGTKRRGLRCLQHAEVSGMAGFCCYQLSWCQGGRGHSPHQLLHCWVSHQ